MFRRIVTSACLAGLLAGLVLTGVQRVRVVPIILEAETYETTAQEAAHSPEGTGHAHEGWAPEEGMERTFWTAIANVLSAIGFALLLVAIYSQRSKVDWRQGVLWGLGGYAAFFLSPAFGLAPEIPGTQAAELGLRQAWWLSTVISTGIGLAMIVLVRPWGWKAAGVVLLVIPHLIGAPHPYVHGASAPQELAHAFALASGIANAIFWVVLGAGSAVAFRRLA